MRRRVFAGRRIPIRMYQGEFAEAPLASPGGKLARPVRGVTEEGWRQPKYCLHFVQWYQPQIIADYFPLFSFIPHMEKVFIKQAPFSTHRTLYKTFGARHPSSVFFVNRFRSADCQKIQLPPGGSQGGLYEFALDFIKLQVPTAPLSRCGGSSPFRGAWGFAPTPAKPFRGAFNVPGR